MVSSIMSETTFAPISLIKMMSRRNQAAIQQGIRCREYNPIFVTPSKESNVLVSVWFCQLGFFKSKAMSASISRVLVDRWGWFCDRCPLFVLVRIAWTAIIVIGENKGIIFIASATKPLEQSFTGLHYNFGVVGVEGSNPFAPIGWNRSYWAVSPF